MKTAAVVMSGCGYLDGAEIREAVITLLELERAGVSYKIFAPDINQHHVVNHITAEEQPGEVRNTLVETARIARGDVQNLADLNPDEFDSLVLPGGFGVAKNLSTIAFDGANCSVSDAMESILMKFHANGKPVGAICISPALVAKVFQNHNISAIFTLGDANPLLKDLNAQEVVCKANEISYDSSNKVVCTPAYMTTESLLNIAEGIHKLVVKMKEIA